MTGERPVRVLATRYAVAWAYLAAIVIAILYGSWAARIAAAADLAILAFAGQIFSGLSRLDVPAVGHTTAIAVSLLLGSLLAWLRRRRAAATADAGAA